jgi:hypothetical protein
MGWAGALPGLTVALRDAGAAATAGWLLAASWGWLDDAAMQQSGPGTSGRILQANLPYTTFT